MMRRQPKELTKELVRESILRLVATEEPTVQRWIREAVRQRLREADLQEAIAAATGASNWAGAIAVNPPAREFEPLEPPGHYSETESWIRTGDELLERSLADYLAKDLYPLPTTADREGYHDSRHFDYWLSGLKDYLLIRGTLERHGAALLPSSRLLDFGCASGRVLRHFLCQQPELESWGTDINGQHIAWMLQFLPETLKAFQCTVLPNLPIPDESMSLVHAFSVFTHIDEFELAWLAELRRILVPGGIAYITIHSDHTWQAMNPNWAIYHDLLHLGKVVDEIDVTLESFQKPLPKERVAFRWKSEATNNANVFYHTDYIRRTWGRFFEVLEIVPEGSDYQDVVVLRKANAVRSQDQTG